MYLDPGELTPTEIFGPREDLGYIPFCPVIQVDGREHWTVEHGVLHQPKNISGFFQQFGVDFSFHQKCRGNSSLLRLNNSQF